jgi:signal transduction histidine kinase
MGIAARLAWVLLVPIALMLALYGYFAHRARQRVLRSEASAELRDHATLVEAAVYGATDPALLRIRLERITRADRVIGIAVFDASGQALLVTDQLAAAAPAVAELARRAVVAGSDLEEELRLPTGPVLARTQALAPGVGPSVAVVARDLHYIDALVRQLDEALLLAGSIVLALTAAAVIVVCRVTVGRPALALVRAVERVAGGDLAATVDERGGEELARLASAFNRMSVSLREARQTVEKEEAARTTAERRLQHARALAALGQVTAGIAHEIGSPLNVILGRARRAAARSDCTAHLEAELKTIAEQSERISRVVSSLLAVARPARPGASRADVRRAAADVLSFLAPECRRRSIVIDDATSLPESASVAMAPDQLFQVLFNVCFNAIEAQPNGGRLTVRIERDAPVEDVGEARRVIVEIEDAGSGVPEDVASRIFEPFFTTKGDRGGTGLGLDIVSGILREAGGRIELVPAAGPGACFRVTLPSAPPAPRSSKDMTVEVAS